MKTLPFRPPFSFLGSLAFALAAAWCGPVAAQETSFLVHRYPFNQAAGTTVPDVVRGLDGEVKGTGFAWDGAELTLDGGASNVAAYVDLPNDLFSLFAETTGGSGAFTVEGWVTIDGVQNWSRIFDFGSTAGGEVSNPGGGGEGFDYIMLSAMNGTDTANRRFEWRNEDPPGGGIFTLDTPISNFGFEFHFALTLDESTGQVRYFEDGNLMVEGTTTLKLDQLRDVNNWLGRSNWTADANTQGSYNEFRIYDGVLSDSQISANSAAGPNSPAGLTDSDGDGMPDGFENRYAFLNPNSNSDAALDQDGDGVTNLAEFQNRTLPDDSDTDNDGASDGREINDVMSDPRRTDTDGDGLSDGAETGTGIFVSVNNTGSSPVDVDSDDDGFEDGREVANNTDPNDPNDFPSQPVIRHRYSFGENAGTVVADSVSGADGAVLGDGFLLGGGMLQLDGGDSNFAAYVDLPNWIISSLTDATIEGWVSNDGSQGWSRIFDFGSTQPGGENGEITGPGDTNGGGTEGLDYFFLSAQVGGDTANQQVEFREADPGPITSDNAQSVHSIPLGEMYHFAVVYDSIGANGNPQIRYYRNGALAITLNTMKRLSQINDVNNWLGRSQWNADGNLQGTFDEFRIYDSALSAAQVQESRTAGPNSPVGIADTDGDGMPDRYEDRYPGFLSRTNPADADQDEDNDDLTNLEEFRLKTSPNTQDSDGDGRTDGNEVNIAMTHPLNGDTDGDGLSDGVETDTGNFVDNGDTGTNPRKVDSDDDAFPDPIEIAKGTDPNDPNDFPRATLMHRYDFNLSQGTLVPDLIGGADGEVLGEGFSWTGTELVLDGGASAVAAYVDLPNGLLSNQSILNGGSGEVTIEGWATVEAVNGNWARLFDFGSSIGGEIVGPGGGADGLDYIMVSAFNGTDTLNRRLEWRDEDPAGGGVLTLDTPTDTFGAEFHFALTFDESTGQIRYYENGNLLINGSTGFTLNRLNDVNNWLGRSNWTQDGNLQGSYNEFRLYDGVVSATQLADNIAAGPDSPPGGGAGRFEVTSIDVDLQNNSVTLTFNSRPGARYALEQSLTLKDGQWLEIDDGIESQGTETSVTFPIPAPPDRLRNTFFRLRQLD